MRLLLLTTALAFAAGPVAASSIEPVASSHAKGPSVQTITCAACPALKEKPKSSQYPVAVLEPGTQKLELKEINGEMKLVRTEAWFGGSPVVFISKAPDFMVKAAVAAAEPTRNAAGVDTTATTAALTADGAQPIAVSKAGTAATDSKPPFDPSRFKLRID